MRPHYLSFAETKQQYGAILRQAQALLEERITALQQRFSCPECGIPSPDSLLTPLHTNCGYKGWQRAALDLIENDLGREILSRLEGIEAYKNTFSCHMCGMCCRLASSERSYPELLAHAEAGDDFARQFTSVFLPYASREVAQAKAPDVVAAVLSEAASESENDPTERVFFYHCPYIGEDNRCTIYGTDKRPDICAQYPETPLSFVYEKCAWKPWKDETHPDTLMAHALLTLATDTANRLKQALG